MATGEGMSLDLQENVWCEGCRKLKKEVTRLQEEHTNYQTLKQKIISTDLLIRKYRTKCEEYDIQSKRLEDQTRKLERSQLDCEMLETQLKASLQSVEPLKQSRLDLEEQLKVKDGEIQKLNNSLEGAEMMRKQFEALIADNDVMNIQEERKQTERKIQTLESTNSKNSVLLKCTKDELRVLKMQTSQSSRKHRLVEAKLNRTAIRLEKYWFILKKHGLVPRGEKKPCPEKILDDSALESTSQEEEDGWKEEHVVPDTYIDGVEHVQTAMDVKSEGSSDNTDDEDEFEDIDSLPLDFHFTFSPICAPVSPLPPSPAPRKMPSAEDTEDSMDVMAKTIQSQLLRDSSNKQIRRSPRIKKGDTDKSLFSSEDESQQANETQPKPETPKSKKSKGSNKTRIKPSPRLQSKLDFAEREDSGFDYDDILPGVSDSEGLSSDEDVPVNNRKGSAPFAVQHLVKSLTDNKQTSDSAKSRDCDDDDNGGVDLEVSSHETPSKSLSDVKKDNESSGHKSDKTDPLNKSEPPSKESLPRSPLTTIKSPVRSLSQPAEKDNDVKVALSPRSRSAMADATFLTPPPPRTRSRVASPRTDVEEKQSPERQSRKRTISLPSDVSESPRLRRSPRSRSQESNGSSSPARVKSTAEETPEKMDVSSEVVITSPCRNLRSSIKTPTKESSSKDSEIITSELLKSPEMQPHVVVTNINLDVNESVKLPSPTKISEFKTEAVANENTDKNKEVTKLLVFPIKVHDETSNDVCSPDNSKNNSVDDSSESDIFSPISKKAKRRKKSSPKSSSENIVKSVSLERSVVSKPPIKHGASSVIESDNDSDVSIPIKRKKISSKRIESSSDSEQESKPKLSETSPKSTNKKSETPSTEATVDADRVHLASEQKQKCTESISKKTEVQKISLEELTKDIEDIKDQISEESSSSEEEEEQKVVRTEPSQKKMPPARGKKKQTEQTNIKSSSNKQFTSKEFISTDSDSDSEVDKTNTPPMRKPSIELKEKNNVKRASPVVMETESLSNEPGDDSESDVQTSKPSLRQRGKGRKPSGRFVGAPISKHVPSLYKNFVKAEAEDRSGDRIETTDTYSEDTETESKSGKNMPRRRGRSAKFQPLDTDKDFADIILERRRTTRSNSDGSTSDSKKTDNEKKEAGRKPVVSKRTEMFMERIKNSADKSKTNTSLLKKKQSSKSDAEKLESEPSESDSVKRKAVKQIFSPPVVPQTKYQPISDKSGTKTSSDTADNQEQKKSPGFPSDNNGAKTSSESVDGKEQKSSSVSIMSMVTPSDKEDNQQSSKSDSELSYSLTETESQMTDTDTIQVVIYQDGSQTSASDSGANTPVRSGKSQSSGSESSAYSRVRKTKPEPSPSGKCANTPVKELKTLESDSCSNSSVIIQSQTFSGESCAKSPIMINSQSSASDNCANTPVKLEKSQSSESESSEKTIQSDKDRSKLTSSNVCADTPEEMDKSQSTDSESSSSIHSKSLESGKSDTRAEAPALSNDSTEHILKPGEITTSVNPTSRESMELGNTAQDEDEEDIELDTMGDDVSPDDPVSEANPVPVQAQPSEPSNSVSMDVAKGKIELNKEKDINPTPSEADDKIQAAPTGQSLLSPPKRISRFTKPNKPSCVVSNDVTDGKETSDLNSEKDKDFTLSDTEDSVKTSQAPFKPTSSSDSAEKDERKTSEVNMASEAEGISRTAPILQSPAKKISRSKAPNTNSVTPVTDSSEPLDNPVDESDSVKVSQTGKKITRSQSKGSIISVRSAEKISKSTEGRESECSSTLQKDKAETGIKSKEVKKDSISDTQGQSQEGETSVNKKSVAGIPVKSQASAIEERSQSLLSSPMRISRCKSTSSISVPPETKALGDGHKENDDKNTATIDEPRAVIDDLDQGNKGHKKIENEQEKRDDRKTDSDDNVNQKTHEKKKKTKTSVRRGRSSTRRDSVSDDISKDVDQKKLTSRTAPEKVPVMRGRRRKQPAQSLSNKKFTSKEFISTTSDSEDMADSSKPAPDSKPIETSNKTITDSSVEVVAQTSEHETHEKKPDKATKIDETVSDSEVEEDMADKNQNDHTQGTISNRITRRTSDSMKSSIEREPPKREYPKRRVAIKRQNSFEHEEGSCDREGPIKATKTDLSKKRKNFVTKKNKSNVDEQDEELAQEKLTSVEDKVASGVEKLTSAAGKVTTAEEETKSSQVIEKTETLSKDKVVDNSEDTAEMDDLAEDSDDSGKRKKVETQTSFGFAVNNPEASQSSEPSSFIDTLSLIPELMEEDEELDAAAEDICSKPPLSDSSLDPSRVASPEIVSLTQKSTFISISALIREEFSTRASTSSPLPPSPMNFLRITAPVSPLPSSPSRSRNSPLMHDGMLNDDIDLPKKSKKKLAKLAKKRLQLQKEEELTKISPLEEFTKITPLDETISSIGRQKRVARISKQQSDLPNFGANLSSATVTRPKPVYSTANTAPDDDLMPAEEIPLAKQYLAKRQKSQQDRELRNRKRKSSEGEVVPIKKQLPDTKKPIEETISVDKNLKTFLDMAEGGLEVFIQTLGEGQDVKTLANQIFKASVGMLKTSTLNQLPVIVKACSENNIEDKNDFMTSIEVKLADLITSIFDKYEECPRHEMMELLWNTIFLPATSLLGRMALCRMFTALCRYEGDVEQVRVFVYKMVTCGYLPYVEPVMAAISVWPLVLKTGEDPAPLVQVIRHVILNSCNNGTAIRKKLSACFQFMCGWSPLTESATQLLASCIEKLKLYFASDTQTTGQVYLFETMKSVELLLWSHGWKFIYTHYMNRHLTSATDAWNSKGDNSILNPAYVISLIRILGNIYQLPRFDQKHKDFSRCIKRCIIQTMDKPTEHKALPLCCVEILAELSPFHPQFFMDVLSHWYKKNKAIVPEAIRRKLEESRQLLSTRIESFGVDAFI